MNSMSFMLKISIVMMILLNRTAFLISPLLSMMTIFPMKMKETLSIAINQVLDMKDGANLLMSLISMSALISLKMNLNPCPLILWKRLLHVWKKNSWINYREKQGQKYIQLFKMKKQAIQRIKLILFWEMISRK